MKFSGTWKDPVVQTASSNNPAIGASPLLVKLLARPETRLAIERAGTVESVQLSSESLDKLDSDEETNENTHKNWLLQLSGDLNLEGFPELFASDPDCVSLLLKSLGIDVKRSSLAHNDPGSVTVIVLKRLFKSCSTKCRSQALASGVIDRLLLRLGDLQAEDPRRPQRSKRFQMWKRTDYSDVPSMSATAPSKDISAQQISGTPSPSPLGSIASATSSGPTTTNSLSGLNALALTSATTAKGGSTESSKVLWKPGYGSGEASASATKAETEREAQRLAKMKRTGAVLDALTAFLDKLSPDEAGDEIFDWSDLLDCLDASCLLRVTMSSFFGVTAKAVVENAPLYISLLNVVATIASKPRLAPLVGDVPGMYKSLRDLMRSMKELANDLVDEDDQASKSLEILIHDTHKVTEEASERLNLLRADSSHDAAREQESSGVGGEADKERSVGQAVSTTVEEHEQKAYEQAMTGEQFKDLDMRDPNTQKYSAHHFQSAIEEDAKDTAASKNRQRRLNRELKALRTTLPLHFGSTIVLRIDRTRPYVGQFIIFAPSNTPYDSGAFLFDFFCSSEYPSEPPKVNLQTTGQGRVRFNPNLYQNGKVCLSLLGTWRGGATGNENWNSETSSLYQVLVSIQSAILGSEFPYFNEPTVEALWGTVEGELQKRIHPNGGYERLRVATIQYAMTAQIRTPPLGFETCIRAHFTLKKRAILQVCNRWLEEAALSNTPGHHQALQEAIDDLKTALHQLSPAADDLTQSAHPTKAPPQLLSEATNVAKTNMHDPKPLSGNPNANSKLENDVILLRAIFPNISDAILWNAVIATANKSEDGEVQSTNLDLAVNSLAKW